MNALSKLLRPAANQMEARQAEVLPDFLQGRTAFGGLVGALVTRSMGASVSGDRSLRTLLVSLVAPLGVGEAQIESHVLRVGRAATHVRSSVKQGELTCAVALACFGEPRSSSVSVAAPRPPELAEPETMAEVPFIQGLTPEFSKFFEYRWPLDAMPFSGLGQGVTQGWLRLRDRLPSSEVFLAALGDAWPSPVLPMLSAPAAFSTLTWSLDVIDSEPSQASNDWWVARSEVESAADGYVQQVTRYWARTGELALVSRQQVAFFPGG